MDVQQLDRIYWQWAEEAAITSDAVDSSEEIAENFITPPSHWSRPDPYLEELEFILNRHTFDFPQLPAILMAYQLSLWAGSDVPPDHPLIQNADHWQEVLIDMGFDNASPADIKQLYILVRGIAKRPELLDNLGDFGELQEFADRPKVIKSEGVKIIRIPDVGDYLIAVIIVGINDEQRELVAFTNLETNETRTYTLDGKPAPVDPDGVAQYLRQSPKTAISANELPSVIGNDLSAAITGENGIGLFDLPYDLN